MDIDPRTILLVLTIILFVLSAAQFAFYIVHRRDTWFLNWGLGNVSATAGVVLFSLFGHLPQSLVVPTANALVVLSWGLCWNGCRRFTGLRSNLTFPVGAAAVLFLLLAFATPVNAHIAGRVLLMSAVLDVMVLATAWILLTAGRNEGLFSARIAGMLAMGIAVMIGFRGVWAASALHANRLMQPEGPLGLLLLPSVAVALVWNLSLMLMTDERMRGILLHDACCDELTQVLNRRGVRAALWRALRRCQDGATTALVLIDMDYLKHFNDTFGHAAGDSLLRCLARAAESQLRSGDSVGRIGGDEFAVILADIDRAGAVAITESIRAEFAAFSADMCPDFRATTSIGIAFIEDADRSIDQIIDRADHALYQAKAARNPRAIGLPKVLPARLALQVVGT